MCTIYVHETSSDARLNAASILCVTFSLFDSLHFSTNETMSSLHDFLEQELSWLCFLLSLKEQNKHNSKKLKSIMRCEMKIPKPPDVVETCSEKDIEQKRVGSCTLQVAKIAEVVNVSTVLEKVAVVLKMEVVVGVTTSSVLSGDINLHFLGSADSCK